MRWRGLRFPGRNVRSGSLAGLRDDTLFYFREALPGGDVLGWRSEDRRYKGTQTADVRASLTKDLTQRARRKDEGTESLECVCWREGMIFLHAEAEENTSGASDSFDTIRGHRTARIHGIRVRPHDRGL